MAKVSEIIRIIKSKLTATYFEKAGITKSGSIPIPEKNFKFPGITAKNFRQEQQIIF